MKQRILGVFAHPDDESFSIGGTLAKYAAQKVEIYLVCATRGQSGQWSDVSPSARKLADVRQTELLTAAKILGVKKVEFLGFKDGQINNNQILGLEEKISLKMKKIKPQVVVTFDPSGISGHLDHIAVSLATTRAFLKVKELKKLYYVVFPRSLAQKFNRLFLGFPDEKITAKLDVSEYWSEKVKALKAHQTQKADWERYLKRKNFPKIEYFNLAHSRTDQLEESGNDLFAGIS
ncbi:PIG-L family deacetylase [Candidatus Microgenomates bacterium]|nr:PIG-L family deacetylase [Candidatus Microgenomates bacterium]